MTAEGDRLRALLGPETCEYIRRQVDQAPAPTPELIAKLRTLLRPPAQPELRRHQAA